ncbi:hypothetical protein Btru_014059 [Bulinus truncatus]|nr:hypothetical protein Btru_014059 [Bulinus truncatus]
MIVEKYTCIYVKTSEQGPGYNMRASMGAGTLERFKMEEQQLVHTYLDIKFQMVKGDNKRTPFSSTEEQIQAKCKQAIEEIERNKKLANSEYTRQQTVFEKKLGQLQKMKQDLGITDSRATRRHSVPHNFFLASPEVRSHGLPILSIRSETALGDESNNAIKPNPLKKKPLRTSTNKVKSRPSLQDVRRVSRDSTEEVNRETLSRFQITSYVWSRP